jgi:hypothetical protein
MFNKYILPLAVMALVAACSSPKYTYHFDHYDYSNGKKEKTVDIEIQETVLSTESAAVGAENTLLASTDETVMTLPGNIMVPEAALHEVAAEYKALTKSEKKEFRKETIRTAKAYAKAVKAGDHERAREMEMAMDGNLKLALIIGVAGLILLLVPGDVFKLIGGLALLVGLVLLILWLAQQ